MGESARELHWCQPPRADAMQRLLTANATAARDKALPNVCCWLCRRNQAGLVITRDRAGRGWFLVLVNGRAEDLLLTIMEPVVPHVGKGEGGSPSSKP